jgi:hypothetical protein
MFDALAAEQEDAQGAPDQERADGHDDLTGRNAPQPV